MLALTVLGGWLAGQAGGADPASVPGDYVELQRLSHGTDTFVFGRRKLAPEFAIWERHGDRLERIELGEPLTANLYFLHALVARDSVFVIAYNTADTIPPGRSRNQYRDGIDLYRLGRDAGGGAQLREVSRMLPLGGIDSEFHDVAIAGGQASCAERGCILFDGAAPRIVTPSAWAGRELIELAGDGVRAFGLFQLAPDDRVDRLPRGGAPVHFVCRIAVDSTCEALPPKVPAELSVVDGSWRVRYAESRDERIAVLIRDLERSPAQRYRFDTNLEGRIAWGQVYLLDAFVDIILAGNALPAALVARARQQLSDELDGIAALSQTETWFWSKRYSVGRQRMATVTHLGRISSLVERARQLPDAADRGELARSLMADLTSLERTIERRDGPVLTIKRDAPFWLDGGNAPWNFQSAWLEAMARGGQSREAVASLVALMVQQERLNMLPITWRYAWGPAHEGWTRADNVSTHTPEWEGNKTRDIGGMAHVSYRTMDARALVVAHRLMQVPLPPGFVDHLQLLVESGWLYPSLAADLAPLGNPPRLDDAIARLYSRSRRPFQIREQLWALGLASATP